MADDASGAVRLDHYLAALERKRDRYLAIHAEGGRDTNARRAARIVQREIDATVFAAEKAWLSASMSGGDGRARIKEDAPAHPRESVARPAVVAL